MRSASVLIEYLLLLSPMTHLGSKHARPFMPVFCASDLSLQARLADAIQRL